jgi:hypothetical protein
LERIEGIKEMCEHIERRFGRALSFSFLYKAIYRGKNEHPLATDFQFGRRTIAVDNLENWYKAELHHQVAARRELLQARRRPRKRAKRVSIRANRRR